MDNKHNSPQSKAPRTDIGHRGPMSMFGSSAKPNDFKGSMRKLLTYLAPYRLSLVFVTILAVASTVFTILSPRMLGNITNTVVDGFVAQTFYDNALKSLPEGTSFPPGTKGEQILKNVPSDVLKKIPSEQKDKIKDLDLSTRPSVNFDSIFQTIVILIILYVSSALFTYLQSWIMTRIAQQVSFNLRAEVIQKIHALPLKYFDTHSIGDILSRITNDVDTIGQTLNQGLAQTITSITLIIGIIIMMLTISIQLTIVAMLILPISFAFIGFIIKHSQKLFKQQADQLGLINGHIEETYSAHNVVRSYNGEKSAIEHFNKINSQLFVSGWKSQFLSGLLMPIMTFIGNLGYVGVATIGGWLAFNGKLGIGGIQAFIQYMQQFNQPVMQAASTTTVLQSTAAAAERVFEFLEEKNEILETNSPKELSSVKGHIQLKNVTFGYDPTKVVINNISVDVKPGQRVAIVGPTGSGKTTIVNLLMRFYDVQKGSILLDGIDIRDLKRSDVRKQFGMVLQDTWLFNGTIKENIAYGKPDATEEEIISAANSAHVDHFVHSLPEGYEFVINENSDNISQGEKQLLTIARAMLANAPILILDEATSSVDTRTEVLIQKAMDRLMEGRTSFIIAHRLSTIRDADLILVLKDGEIIEQGNHEQLMNMNGFYCKLYNSQFEE